jgi:hypothetical protein
MAVLIIWNSAFLLIDIGKIPVGPDGNGRELACLKVGDGSSINIIH